MVATFTCLGCQAHAGSSSISDAWQAFRTEELRWLVLDEADRLLDLGFEQKIGAPMSACAWVRMRDSLDVLRSHFLLKRDSHAPPRYDGQWACSVVHIATAQHCLTLWTGCLALSVSMGFHTLCVATSPDLVPER